MGRHHLHLVRDAALAQLLRGLLHRLHVACGAHHDADERSVYVELLELRLHLGFGEIGSYRCGGGVAHCAVVVSRSAFAAMSCRSCIPSKEMFCAAAYADARADPALAP